MDLVSPEKISIATVMINNNANAIAMILNNFFNFIP